MSKLDELKALIEELDHGEFWQLARWFGEYRADRWDRHIEADAKAGKLDKLLKEAEADLRAGRTRRL